ncbi:hypothetical protein PGQ11_013441 [Apiospora arundinis]|uniref:Uncharacterized protein n=1 Tax=Apiospora arundinis TaxID=335852 RepID=A0ABR2HQJ2_9PEZI
MMEMTNSPAISAASSSISNMEGWEIPPGVVLLGKRVKIDVYYDKYEVHQRPGGVVPFLNAHVFDLSPDPIKVRKHRKRCIKRLESRKVLEDTRRNLHVVVFVKDLAAPKGQIPRDAQDWLDWYASHVHARQEEIISKQDQPDNILVGTTSSRLGSESSIDLELDRQEVQGTFMDGALLVFKDLLWQMIGGITSLVWLLAVLGTAYLVIFGTGIVGWLLLSLW